jgi:hypothetical protein
MTARAAAGAGPTCRRPTVTTHNAPPKPHPTPPPVQNLHPQRHHTHHASPAHALARGPRHARACDLLLNLQQPQRRLKRVRRRAADAHLGAPRAAALHHHPALEFEVEDARVGAAVGAWACVHERVRCGGWRPAGGGSAINPPPATLWQQCGAACALFSSQRTHAPALAHVHDAAPAPARAQHSAHLHTSSTATRRLCRSMDPGCATFTACRSLRAHAGTPRGAGRVCVCRV